MKHALITALLPILMLVPVVSVRADDAASISQRGRALYRQGQYQEAADLLGRVIEAGKLDSTTARTDLEYLWRSQFRLGKADSAGRSVFRLLDLDSTWRPNPDRVPPEEIAFFDGVAKDWHPALPPPSSTSPPPPPSPAPASRPMITPPMRSSKKVLWYSAGGTAVVGTALYLLFHKHTSSAVVGASAFGAPPAPPGN